MARSEEDVTSITEGDKREQSTKKISDISRGRSRSRNK